MPVLRGRRGPTLMISGWSSLMGTLPFEWAQYGFMHNALLAVLLAAPLLAVLGSLVISNHMAFFSEAIGHASLTGVAIGVLLGLADPLWAMVVFSLLLALAVTGLRKWSAISTDTVIGLVMAAAVALGVVLLSRGGGFSRYTRYLIGDLLTINPVEIMRMALVFAGVVVVGFMGFNRVVMVSFNRSLARSRNMSPGLVETLFAAVVAVVVTVAIPWVGILVINALLILPAAAARNIARNMPNYILLSAVFSILAGVSGLVISYYLSTATGATIVLVAMAIFLLTLPWRNR